MTRLRHFFKHLSAAAKRSSVGWDLLKKVHEAERHQFRSELIASVKRLERSHQQILGEHGPDSRLLEFELRIGRLKIILAKHL